MASTWIALKRLSLGLLLIAAASAILLLSDRGQRAQAGSRRAVPVAIVQHASTPVLDDGVQGVIEGLAEQGFRDGETLAITTYNAQGDLATGNAIARQVTTGEFDMVITSSTPSMQAVANANRDGRVMHVFTLVADPFSAGVGLDRAQPAEASRATWSARARSCRWTRPSRSPRRALPALARVGVAWNPAESNSVAFTLKAREACRELGLTLLEANVDSSAAVTEAVQSLVSRGAQAIWVGGDNTMLSAIGSVIATARAARIPVFTIMPGAPDRGTLFDVGPRLSRARARSAACSPAQRAGGRGPGDDAHPRRARRGARGASSSTRRRSPGCGSRGACPTMLLAEAQPSSSMRRAFTSVAARRRRRSAGRGASI